MSHVDATTRNYIQKIRQFAHLEATEEYELAKNWNERHDPKDLKKLVESHLNLVTKIAYGYRGYGLPLAELIAEGHIGLLHAIKNFDPDRGFRLSTYGMWWIRSNIQDYIMRTWSMVRLGTTRAHRKLFFKLRRTEEEVRQGESDITLRGHHVTQIAEKLQVPENDVWYMSQRMQSRDSSLNAPVDQEESESEWMDWLIDERETPEVQAIHNDEMKKRHNLLEKALSTLTPREHQIVSDRRLADPPLTLEAIAQKMNISAERVRQIEHSGLEKMKKEIKKQASHVHRKHPLHI